MVGLLRLFAVSFPSSYLAVDAALPLWVMSRYVAFQGSLRSCRACVFGFAEAQLVETGCVATAVAEVASFDLV